MPSPARMSAYRILLRVESGRAFAVDLLHAGEVSGLKEIDRKLATELVMGVLRWGRGLDFEIERLAGKPVAKFDAEVRTILRLGVYQIQFLDRVPKAATVNEAVEMTKAVRMRSATGLVNAVLRKCESRRHSRSGGGQPSPDLARRELAARSIPEWLFERWRAQFGAEAAAALAWQSTEVPPATLRISWPAASREAVERALEDEGVATRPCRFSPLGLTVVSGDAASSQTARAGSVALQDEASQLVAELLAAKPGDSVLDVCAAPGTKTAQIACAIGAGEIVACDVSARRLRTMALLLAKLSPAAPRPVLVRLDATRPLPFGRDFTRILLDAPCSGTGTLGRNPEIKYRLGLADLPRLAETQKSLLRHSLDALQPGGRLVYATCSLEPEENDRVVDETLKGREEFRRLCADELRGEFPAFASLFDSQGYFRTRPDLHAMDGFFAAVLLRL